MGLINDGNAPGDLTHDVEITNEGVVGRDDDIELEVVGGVRTIGVVPLVLAHDIAPNALTVVVDAASHVGPALKFTAPMLDGRERNDDQKWSL